MDYTTANGIELDASFFAAQACGKKIADFEKETTEGKLNATMTEALVPYLEKIPYVYVCTLLKLMQHAHFFKVVDATLLKSKVFYYAPCFDLTSSSALMFFFATFGSAQSTPEFALKKPRATLFDPRLFKKFVWAPKPCKIPMS